MFNTLREVTKCISLWNDADDEEGNPLFKIMEDVRRR